MSLPSLSLNRPVLATVMNLVIILFGAIAFSRLGVREYPAIDPPVITVRTSYTGANAEIVESQITEPLEKRINGIAGIQSITSQSALGVSNITVTFNVDADLESAANDVRDKVSQARRDLPQDLTEPPVVTKSDADDSPVIFMPVQSKSMSITELSDFAENVLLEKLQTIPEVSAVQIFGQKKPAMRLWIDPIKLSAYGLTIQDVQDALSRENVDLPGGKVYGSQTEMTVKTFGRLTTEADFENLIIKEATSQIVRLRDIGRAELGAENEESLFRKNGYPAISLGVLPQPGANIVKIADEFHRRIEAMKSDIPADMVMEVGIDKSKFVKQSIDEVEETLFISIALVVLIIFLFFRDWKVALRPLVDIPVSLIGAFFIMYIAGFSINVLTLLAIVLATGLVVDDGIVVSENIFKKVEQGKSLFQAAREGSNEILFAVLSTSLTLAVVFLPVIFMPGFVGGLFREFGIVVAGAVIISAFVSLSLTPVLSVKLANKHGEHGWFYRVTEPFFVGLDHAYRQSLQAFLKVRWLALVIVVACAWMAYHYYTTLQTELAPLEDRSLIRVPLTAPEGTSYDAMTDIVMGVNNIFQDSINEAKFIFSSTAPGFGSGATNSGFVNAILVEPEQRGRSQKEIAQWMGKKMQQFTSARGIPVQEQTISQGFRSSFSLPVQFVVQNLSFEKLRAVLPKMLEKANQDPTFQGVDADLKFNRPELEVTIDRLKAAELGVSVRDISNTLQLALSNSRFGYFLMNGKQYQVVGQVERNDRDAPTDLATFFVRNKEGRLIQLDNLVKMEEKATPPQVFHYNRYKSATISAGLAPGKTIGDGIAAMEKIADEFLDESFVTSLSGPSRDFAESSGNTSFAFILALVLIYLVLSAQFESFRDPLIIMFTVPLAIAGALLSLALMDQTLNIFSQIGMIMLIGLVTKNGILIVDFANHKQREGLNKWNAVLEGSAARLRPILMTSLVTAIGALPIALALGSASLSRVPLGVVIVGGVIFSLILTLYVIPAMYTFISGQKKSEEELQAVQEGKVSSGTMAGLIGLLAICTGTSMSAQNVLSPEQVVETALQNNALRKVLQSDVKRWMTENQYLRYNQHPTVGLTGGASYNINNTRQEFVSGAELSRNGAQAYQFNAGIASSWQVYDGGRARLAREIGAQQGVISQSQLNANATELTELVLNAYFTIAWLEQQLKLLEEQSQLIQFRFNLSDDRFKAGLAGQQEALQAQVDLNDVRNRIVANRGALQAQWALLRQLTGNGPEFRINTQLDMPVVPDSTAIYNQMVNKNPQLQLLMQQRKINLLNEQVAKTGKLPLVQLNAGYNFLNQRNQAGFLAFQFNHGFTASILATYPIFDQYATRRNTEVAKVLTEQVDLQTKASTEQLFTTFQLAMNDLALARQTLVLEQSNEQTARQLLLIANERFKQGLSNALELREVQFSLENIQFRQLQARYQANLALARLKGLGAL